MVAFALATALLNQWSLPPWAGFAGVLVGAGFCLRLIPAPTSRGEPVPSPAWDMPARLAIAAAFVVLQTGIAGWLGPQLSGLVTPFPIVVILLTAFAHHQLGEARCDTGAARLPDRNVRVRDVLSRRGARDRAARRRGRLPARTRCVPGHQRPDALGLAAATVEAGSGGIERAPSVGPAAKWPQVQAAIDWWSTMISCGSAPSLPFVAGSRAMTSSTSPPVSVRFCTLIATVPLSPAGVT